jgi:hypothetical protein
MDGATIRYRDARGHLQELRVDRATARALASIRRAARREEERWRARHVAFSDVGIDPGRVAEGGRPRPKATGYPWEGPRFAFELLLGASPSWAGEDSLRVEVAERWRCRFCGHYGRGLPRVAYCLACDRSGRDREIPALTTADLDRRTRQVAAAEGTPGKAAKAGRKAKGGEKGRAPLRGGLSGKR